jgi:hypothetical protein
VPESSPHWVWLAMDLVTKLLLSIDTRLPAFFATRSPPTSFWLRIFGAKGL